MRYHGTHVKESSKRLQAGLVDGVFFQVWWPKRLLVCVASAARQLASFFFALVKCLLAADDGNHLNGIGARPNAICVNLTVFWRPNSGYIWRNV